MVEGIVDKAGVGVAGRSVRMTSIVVVVDGIDGIGEFGLPGFRSHELNNKIGNMNENNKLVPNPGLVLVGRFRRNDIFAKTMLR